MTHVVDTSAVLAAMLGERGGDQVVAPGRSLHLSIVNLGEIYTKVVKRGGLIADVDAYLAGLPIRIRAFRKAHAAEVALLRPETRHRGISFGDRACLGLARVTMLPVLTADTKWAELDIGVDIRLIR